MSNGDAITERNNLIGNSLGNALNECQHQIVQIRQDQIDMRRAIEEIRMRDITKAPAN